MVIKGHVFTLQRYERDSDALAKLEVINGECERLAYLVEDLLERSRARVGGLRLAADTFPLRGCVEEVVERLGTVADQRGVTVDVILQGNGAVVMGDQL